eukprot:TRINITY_DN779798_c0_g1_i1.p1 TRINITY_DN779798_c0_g1~~TRINITY_DN779798_c0_g1_i1.p1  ORF type:complete len:322 (+),score=63.21 TRINITY_DN779798_c0_g1_i1:112-1077(+)
MEFEEDVEELAEFVHLEWKDLNKWKFLTLNPLFFTVLRGALYPMSLIKTRLQVQTGNEVYKGVFDAAKSIAKTEGLRGFYRGFLTSTYYIASGNIYIASYELARQLVYERELPFSNGKTVTIPMANFFAGATSSIITQSVVVPIDIVTQRLMMQGQKGMGEVLKARDIFRSIYRNEGMSGFMRGYSTSLLTYVPNSAIWWSAYGVVSSKLYNMFKDKLPSDNAAKYSTQALGGSIAGLTAAVLTNPMDVIRTRHQVLTADVARVSIKDTVSSLLKTEGAKGLLKGVCAKMLSQAPSGAMVCFIYETTKRLSQISNDEQAPF